MNVALEADSLPAGAVHVLSVLLDSPEERVVAAQAFAVDAVRLLLGPLLAGLIGAVADGGTWMLSIELVTRVVK